MHLVYHSRLFFILIGVIGAAVFSIGLAVILEYLDNKLDDPKALEKMLNTPALGSIPRF